MFHHHDHQSSNQVHNLGARGPFSAMTGISSPSAEINEQLQQAETEGETRRKRLGYQRASVACSYCRRRKIRCIMPTSGARGHCINCIRLKRECSLFLITQKSSSYLRDSPAYSASKSTVEIEEKLKSSPALSTGSPAEQTPFFSALTESSVSAPILMTNVLDSDTRLSPGPGVPSVSLTNQNPFEMGNRDLRNWTYANTKQHLSSNKEMLDPTLPASSLELSMSTQAPLSVSLPHSLSGWVPMIPETFHGDIDPGWDSQSPSVRSMPFGGEPSVIPSTHQYYMAASGQVERGVSVLPDIYAVPELEAVTMYDTNPTPSSSDIAERATGCLVWDLPQSQPDYILISNRDAHADGWLYTDSGLGYSLQVASSSQQLSNDCAVSHY